ncbi:MAG: glycosyltransferase family 2 protein [Candidatus Aenigmarchaeota archaeon]|nr:glycosyltransferase family 2 protein [Candidatus Aenigmarchaeota archaeon]
MHEKRPVGISVVIPTYNRPGQVSRCIMLLLGSKGLGDRFVLEVIVVDDSPNDNVKRRIDRLTSNGEKGATFRYIKPRQSAGIAKARNMGVRAASNGIIIATDSDIEVENDTVLNTLLAFEDNPHAAMVSGRVFWRGGAVDGKLDRPRKHDRRVRVGKTTYIEMLHGRYVAFRRPAFMAVGGYDWELFPLQGEGPDLSIRFWRAGYPLVYDHGIKVHHLSGYAKREKMKSPYLYHNWNMHRTAMMLRSMLLYFYKYGGPDPAKSNWRKTISLESERNFGDGSEYMILSSLSGTLGWIAHNWKAMEKSRKRVPKRYDFKPYDVFSDRQLFMSCIKSSMKK